MTSNNELVSMAGAARATVIDPARITFEGEDANPRFELFHASTYMNSII